MFYHITKHYLKEKFACIPLAVDVVLEGDRHLYLFHNYYKWYVIVEADHLTLDSYTIEEIEEAFPVKVVGWCTLLEYQKEGGKQMVTTEENEAARKEANETPPEHKLTLEYKDVAFTEPGDSFVYALLEVKPNPGIDLRSFGLSFYKNFDDESAKWEEWANPILIKIGSQS